MYHSKLVVFDIDGTLANIEHRRHYVQSKPKNWHAFNEAMVHDTVYEPVLHLNHMFSTFSAGHDYDVALASGRGEEYREHTVKWLHDKDVYYDHLFMRPAKDNRPDYIIKEEILEKIIEIYGKKPDMVVDDRPQVVRMWREKGIFVFDVNQSGEEF